MRYDRSAHFNEDAQVEVDNARSAGNSDESLMQTFQARLAVEQRRYPVDEAELERVQTQINYVALGSGQLVVAEIAAQFKRYNSPVTLKIPRKAKAVSCHF